MTKKGLTRLKRVLGATIKNHTQVGAVGNYLAGLELRLEAHELERSHRETWRALAPAKGDVFYAAAPRSKRGTKPLWGKAITVRWARERLRQVSTDHGVFDSRDMTEHQFSRELSPDAFTELVEKT